MNNSFQQIKNILLNNKILVIFLALAALSIVILFFINTRDSGNTNTESNIESPIYGINTNASSLNELNISSKKVEEIHNKVNSIAKKNGAKEDVEISDISIREGSIKVKDFSNTDLTTGYVNMIVDIPNIKHSYQLVFSVESDKDTESSSAKKNTPSSISCIYDSSKIKYKNFSCKDQYDTDPKYDTLSYYGERASTNGAKLYLYEDTRELIVDVTSYNGTEEQAIDDAKKWVESMGYSTEGIEFSTGYFGGAPPQEQPGGVPDSPGN